MDAIQLLNAEPEYGNGSRYTSIKMLPFLQVDQCTVKETE
jgi:hypothetical protein